MNPDDLWSFVRGEADEWLVQGLYYVLVSISARRTLKLGPAPPGPRSFSVFTLPSACTPSANEGISLTPKRIRTKRVSVFHRQHTLDYGTSVLLVLLASAPSWRVAHCAGWTPTTFSIPTVLGLRSWRCSVPYGPITNLSLIGQTVLASQAVCSLAGKPEPYYYHIPSFCADPGTDNPTTYWPSRG